MTMPQHCTHVDHVCKKKLEPPKKLETPQEKLETPKNWRNPQKIGDTPPKIWRHPPKNWRPPVDRHTPVNLLPCPKLHLRAVTSAVRHV